MCKPTTVVTDMHKPTNVVADVCKQTNVVADVGKIRSRWMTCVNRLTW